MKRNNNIVFQPIGYVRSTFKEPRDTVFCCEQGLKAKNTACIVIDKKYQKGLDGIKNFSHVFVLYFLDKIKRTELLTYPGPTSIKKLPRVGVFASRSQYRPNPLALRLVKLVNIKANTLTVRGLDAIDGSPVLDLKPYVPGFDRPARYRQARWYRWLPYCIIANDLQ
jgi:tRNA-Thr(GGU) m(6)t(6)A37 methyltransferase TsaA